MPWGSLMTVSNEIKKAKKRDERAEKLRVAFEEGLLRDMQSPGDSRDDAGIRRAALKMYNDGLATKCDAMQAELDELKKAAGNTADLDAAVAAKNAEESELGKIKAEWSATVNAQVKKAQDAVSNERIALTQREVAVKRKEDALAVSTDKALTVRAFDYLSNMVRRMESWRPTEFFDHEIPKSPWLWRTWWPEDKAKLWCAWEVELGAMPREKQVARIASDLHAYGCIQHQREKNDLSPERKEFLEARVRYMNVDQEVFEINRRMTEYCRLQPHPLPAPNVDYEYGARRNMQTKMITGEVPSYL